MFSILNYSGHALKVLERLKAHYGTDSALAEALGLDTSYTSKWRKKGYISETYALDVDDLGVVDGEGLITAYEVLHEAREVRVARAAA